MKYVYEMYEHTTNKGIVFKGYKTIDSDSSESARLSAEESVADNVVLHEVFLAQ